MIIFLCLTGCEKEVDNKLDINGTYSSKDEVALYIHLYDKLPSNYITKKEAKALGWDASLGNLWDVAYGKSIGGDYFGNYEGGYRNEKRIIYSDAGDIYYTDDHYESFELLYGEE